VLSEDLIPSGPYCYASLDPMDTNGHMRIKGMCPYWESRPGEHAYCRFLNYETEFERELLWDQVKACGIRDGFDAVVETLEDDESNPSAPEAS